jgi:hypothetical protein
MFISDTASSLNRLTAFERTPGRQRMLAHDSNVRLIICRIPPRYRGYLEIPDIAFVSRKKAILVQGRSWHVRR